MIKYIRLAAALLAALLVLPLSAGAAPQDVVATMGALNVTEEELTQTAYNLAYYGMAKKQNDVRFALEYLLTNQKAPLLKAHEYGFDQLAAQEEETIQQQAQTQFEAHLDRYVAEKIQKGAPDSAASRAALRREAEDYWASYGTTRQYYIDSFRTQTILEKLYTKMDLSVSAQDIQAQYDQLVERDRQRFETNIKAYEFALNFEKEALWYHPAGYRLAELLWLDTPPQLLNNWKKLRAQGAADEDTQAAAQALLEAVQPQVQQAQALLQSGLSYVQAQQKLGKVPVAIQNARHGGGFLVHPQSAAWDQEVRRLVFSVPNPVPGQLLGLAPTPEGVVMAYYIGPAPQGPAVLDDSARALLGQRAAAQKEQAYLQQWRSEYPVTIDEKALQRLEQTPSAP